MAASQLSEKVPENSVPVHTLNAADKMAPLVKSVGVVGNHHRRVNQGGGGPAAVHQIGNGSYIPDCLGSGEVVVGIGLYVVHQVIADFVFSREAGLQLGNRGDEKIGNPEGGNLHQGYAAVEQNLAGGQVLA